MLPVAKFTSFNFNDYIPFAEQKYHIPQRTWREVVEPHVIQLGQVFFYLVAQQLNTLLTRMHPFMAEGNVRTLGLTSHCFLTINSYFQFCPVIAIVDREEDTRIVLTIGKMVSLAEGVMPCMLANIWNMLAADYLTTAALDLPA